MQHSNSDYQFDRLCLQEDRRVSERPESEVQNFRREKEIQIFGSNVPKPVMSFDEVNFPSYIMAEIKRAGFANPSPIQCQSWPMALSGRDLVYVVSPDKVLFQVVD